MSLQEVKKITIDAKPKGNNLHYKELNKQIRDALRDGHNWIVVENVSGQRYIGAGIKEKVTIEIFGDVGLDLGAFSEGLTIIVHGNSEYLLGNTLNEGELVVYGDSWDITGMGARGGRIFVMGNGGSRVGIHMKEFKDKKPAIIYGGKVKQYCGEYMAGGLILVLGLNFKDAVIDTKKPIGRDNIDPLKVKDIEGEIVQSDLGGGMHGGAIYIRGEVPDEYLGVYATKKGFTEEDKIIITPIVERFCELFNVPPELVWGKKFTKIVPVSHRPFGKQYVTTPI
ncbi:MAG: hypothetical protein HY929_08200 [Euryarchaeota archaeon]|nr:hypothetical protein [Euryarchaeota archaeon]